MPTRCRLRFIQRTVDPSENGETKTKQQIARIYRHSDGYPSGVLPALAQLKTLRDQTGTVRDPWYVGANLIFLSELQGMGYYANRAGGFGGTIRENDVLDVVQRRDIAGFMGLEQPHFLLMYGVEDPTTGTDGDEGIEER